MIPACENPAIVGAIVRSLEDVIDYIKRHPEGFVGRYPDEKGPEIIVRLEPMSDKPMPGFLPSVQVTRTDAVVPF